ncbi:unnamed protein product [Phytophthora lilii]|uniref:Unnamed protein product n=1 Tax=Phytophthora lilii TaxID=2077276 RepID=A0A9W6U0F0_9STRA|nr:unnamed protein product [Phytophthora lilii]
MGKSTTSNNTAEKEFAKLEQLLIQTADDVADWLKVSKANLAEYDKRHGLVFINTAKSFMRSDIRGAKDSSSELRHVAYQISKSELPSEKEITAARSQIHTLSDAISQLKKTARAYDKKNLAVKPVTGIIDAVLPGGNYSKTEEISLSSNSTNSESEESWVGEANKGSNNTHSDSFGRSDKVEAVVKTTLRNRFSGFSAIKYQLSVAESSLSPSFAERIMDTMASMSDSLKGDDKFAPRDTEKRSASV